MKIYLLFVIVIVAFSCTKRDVSSTNNDSQSLKFESIRYALENGDGITKDTVSLKPLSAVNNTSVRQAVLFNPVMKEYSLFRDDSGTLGSLLKDSVRVNVPHDLSANSNILLGESAVLLCDSLTSGPAFYTFKDSLYVQPNEQITLDAKQVNNVITVTYYATFSETVSGEKHIVKGKWVGEIPVEVITETKIEDIK